MVSLGLSAHTGHKGRLPTAGPFLVFNPSRLILANRIDTTSGSLTVRDATLYHTRPNAPPGSDIGGVA